MDHQRSSGIIMGLRAHEVSSLNEVSSLDQVSSLNAVSSLNEVSSPTCPLTENSTRALPCRPGGKRHTAYVGPTATAGAATPPKRHLATSRAPVECGEVSGPS
jgi:hypothetical protein